MSADLLRRAAKVLREHAEGASPGPWKTVGTGTVESQVPDGHTILDRYECDVHPDRAEPDAAYVALMHPPVALALADLLDECAESVEQDSTTVGCVDVARAILREPQ